MTRNLDEGQTGFTLGIQKRAGDLSPPLRVHCAHVLIRCIPEDGEEEEAYTRGFGTGEKHEAWNTVRDSIVLRAAINSPFRFSETGIY